MPFQTVYLICLASFSISHCFGIVFLQGATTLTGKRSLVYV